MTRFSLFRNADEPACFGPTLGSPALRSLQDAEDTDEGFERPSGIVRCAGRLAATPAPSPPFDALGRRTSLERLVETYTRSASLGLYGAFQVGFARSFRMPPDQDVLVSARSMVPFWERFVLVKHPEVSTRGELLRGLAPLVARLGIDVEARQIETVRLLSALAEVLYSDVDGRLIPWPRHVFVGDDPTFHPRYQRSHLVVIDPRPGREPTRPGEAHPEGRHAERSPEGSGQAGAHERFFEAPREQSRRFAGELAWLSSTHVRVP